MVRHAARFFRPVIVALALVSLVGASVAHGQGLGQPDTLTLQKFLAQVDSNYPKLRSMRIERDVAEAKFQEKKGAFDPSLSFETSFLRYNSSTTRGKLSESRMTETVVEVLDRSGIKFLAGQRLNMGSVKSPSSSTGSLGEWFVGAKIPLIRDLGLNPKRAAESQAAYGIPLAEKLILEARLDTLTAAGIAYWDWVGAGDKLRISKSLLQLAIDRAKFIRARFDAGAIPRIDTDEADAEVFRRRAQLEKAERDLQKAELKLSGYFWDDKVSVGQVPDRRQLPQLSTVAPVNDEELGLGLERAKNARPELEAIRVTRNILKIDLALAKNDMRPALDLVVNPGYDPGEDGIGATYKAGLIYSVPLVQNQARGRISQANSKLLKLDLEETQLRRQIELEVLDAESALRQNYSRLQATDAELEANRRLEKGETDRFTLGIGTLFLINQRERARAETETRLIDVRVEYEQSLVTYRFVTAQLAP